MTTEGFTLNPGEIVDEIRSFITRDGWSLKTWLDTYRHADFNTGMTMVHDPVDRAVVVFVGSREEAAAVEIAARRALEPPETGSGD